MTPTAMARGVRIRCQDGAGRRGRVAQDDGCKSGAWSGNARLRFVARASSARSRSAGMRSSEPEEIWLTQRQSVSDELGWTGASEAYDAILTVRLDRCDWDSPCNALGVDAPVVGGSQGAPGPAAYGPDGINPSAT